MRLFVAIELTKQIKKQLAEVCQEIEFIKASWVNPDNIHLTLKFLGEVDEGLLPKIKSSLNKALKDTTTLTLTITDFGAFPSPKKARVFWVGTQKSEELKSIANKIGDALVPLGFEKEKRSFKAHLTIARLRAIKDITTQLKKLKPINQEILVKEVVLFKSKLSPKGAVYDKLLVVPLKNIL